MAQPSLSQQVRKLELTLGHRLFDRLGRGVALTDAGRALLPRAKSILAQVNEAQASLEGDIQQGAGRLAIGAIPTMAPYLLPHALAELSRRFARCELTVVEDLTDHLIEHLMDNRIDVAITSTPIDHELLEVTVLGSEEFLVVAPADHPMCGSQQVTLANLRRQPTITLSEMHCLGQQIAGFCSLRKLARHVTCRTTQLSIVLLVRRSRHGRVTGAGDGGASGRQGRASLPSPQARAAAPPNRPLSAAATAPAHASRANWR